MSIRVGSGILAVLALMSLASCASQNAPADSARQLNVVLIPADGGTEGGTRADYQPLFDTIAQSTGLRFDLKVAQSYGAVVEALCNGTADIAFVGPVTYLQANKRGCAELLAVAVKDGESVYFAGLFARADSQIETVSDLKGHSVAFGDVNSASSFIFPLAMLIEGGVDPVQDMRALRLTGSHANSLAALIEGRVDAAALSFDSYEKALRNDIPGVRDIKVVARSEAIPYPPLVINTRLPDEVKQKLRSAFTAIGTAPGIRPEMIRGYGGKQVDGYDTAFPAESFDLAARKMALITDDLKGEILAKSSDQ